LVVVEPEVGAEVGMSDGPVSGLAFGRLKLGQVCVATLWAWHLMGWAS
jgi:hypothetical protein